MYFENQKGYVPNYDTQHGLLWIIKKHEYITAYRLCRESQQFPNSPKPSTIFKALTYFSKNGIVEVYKSSKQRRNSYTYCLSPAGEKWYKELQHIIQKTRN